MKFFDKYDCFIQSSIVGNWPDRLNARYEAIIAANASRFHGARVLDLASHDGRWTFAALEAGAAHVVGIEVRDELIDAANRNMALLGVTPDRYRFEFGDIFERDDVFCEPFDVVLCLGLLYHTVRHVELIHLIRSTNAPTLILDTRLLDMAGEYSYIQSEAAEHPANGKDDIGVRDGQILVATPTSGAVRLTLGHFGYTVYQYDWLALLARLNLSTDLQQHQSEQNPVGDYARRERGTFLATLVAK